MSDDLSIVPGIGQGKANKAALEHAGIFTPYQLLGQFLLLKASGMVRAPRASVRGRDEGREARAARLWGEDEPASRARALSLTSAARPRALSLTFRPPPSLASFIPQDSQQHMDAFYEWLTGIGIKTHQAMICLGLAEKAKSMMSNVFNEAELDPPNK